jgi:hypothetical protein
MQNWRGFFRGEEGGWLIGRWDGVAGWLGTRDNSEWSHALLGSLQRSRHFVNDQQLWEHPVSPRVFELQAQHIRGVGPIDVHLIAAVSLNPCAELWAMDGSLRKMAARLKIDANLPWRPRSLPRGGEKC